MGKIHVFGKFKKMTLFGGVYDCIFYVTCLPMTQNINQIYKGFLNVQFMGSTLNEIQVT